MEELAGLANTSTATVSRVLNNKPGVTPATRKRVLDLAGKLGYRPNRIAQNLALQKSHLLGFIAADLLNSFYIDFFRRVQHRVEKMGYQVLIADSERNIDEEKHNIDVMLHQHAEGMLIFPVHDCRIHTDINHLLELRVKKYPLVVLGKVDGRNFDSVTNEEIETAYTMTRHLTDYGHRRIAFIGYESEDRPVGERFEGVLRAAHEAGCNIDQSLILAHRDGWTSDLVDLLTRPDRPTALVIMNDVLALLAHRTINELGLSVPRDLSIVTFGNNIWTRHLKPTLTSTAENCGEVARIAIDLLLKRMEDPECPTMQYSVPQDFIVRESTGTCPITSQAHHESMMTPLNNAQIRENHAILL